MSDQLFVINYDDGVSGFYIDLEKAKIELKNIYDKTPDYKYFDYKINVYKLNDKEYTITDTYYIYKFDTFLINTNLN